MALSQDLINQFAKMMNSNEKQNEVTVKGTYKTIDGEEFVQIDGSEIWTPVTSTVEAEDGERVTVLIKDHTATITGNITSPSARTKSVESLKEEVDEHGNTIQQLDNSIKQQANSIIQMDNNIKQVENSINQYDNTINQQGNTIQQFDSIIKEQGDTITSMNNTITQQSNQITEINNTIDSQNNVISQHDNIITQHGNLIDQQGNTIKEHGNNIELFDSNIKILNSGFVIKDGVLTGLSEIIVQALETDTLNVKYANIDFTNINYAAVQKIFTESGIINDLVISEGKITGELVGVTIKGDLIEGNTVKADKLVIKGDDGLYYKLNVDSLGETVASSDTKYQNGLDGSVIIANSIVAEKVAVDDLVAFGATIGGFNISNNAIYSGVKESIDNTTQGIYMDKTGQFAIGDENNFIKYFLDPETNSYKLLISTDEFSIDSYTKTETDNMIENIENTLSEDYYDKTETDVMFEESKVELIKEFEGDFVTLTDAGHYQFEEFNMRGKSEQATRSGKNKFDGNNNSSSYWSSLTFADDILTITGISTSIEGCKMWTFDVSETDVFRLNAIILNSNGKIIIQYSKDGSAYTNLEKLYYIDGKSVSSYSYTVPADVISIKVNFYNNNETPTEITSSSYSNIIVTINEADMTYEPYGAMPSPNYSSDIKSVGTVVNMLNQEEYNKASMFGYGTQYFAYAEMPHTFKTKFIGNAYLKGTEYTNLVVGFSDVKTSVAKRIYDKGTYYENVEYDFSNSEHVYLIIGNNQGINRSVDVPAIFDNYDIIATKSKNSIDLVINRKNWFNIKHCRLDTAYNGSYPVIETVDENNFTMTCNKSDDWQGIYLEKLKEGKYVVEFDATLLSVSNDNAYQICVNSSGTNANRTTLVLNEKTHYKLTTNAPLGKIYIGSFYNTVKFENVIIREDGTDETYESYNESRYPFTLEDGQELCGIKTIDSSLANYTDENGQLLIVDYLAADGIHKRIPGVVLDGVNNKFVQKGGATKNITWMTDTIYAANNDTPILCTHMKKTLAYNAYYNGSTGVYIENKRIKLAFDLESELTTLDLANAWLAEEYAKGTPVTIKYVSASEEIIPYTEEQQKQYDALQNAYTYENITHIYTTNEIKPILYGKYYTTDRDEMDVILNKELNGIKNEVFANTTSIVQDSQKVMIEALEEYVLTGDFEKYQETVSTQFELTANEFNILFNTAITQITNLNGETQSQFQEIQKYIRFVDGNIILGEVGNELTLKIQNDRISFLQNNLEVAYFSNNKLYVTDGEFINSLQIGKFAFKPRANGSLSFGKVGG